MVISLAEQTAAALALGLEHQEQALHAGHLRFPFPTAGSFPPLYYRTRKTRQGFHRRRIKSSARKNSPPNRAGPCPIDQRPPRNRHGFCISATVGPTATVRLRKNRAGSGARRCGDPGSGGGLFFRHRPVPAAGPPELRRGWPLFLSRVLMIQASRCGSLAVAGKTLMGIEGVKVWDPGVLLCRKSSLNNK